MPINNEYIAPISHRNFRIGDIVIGNSYATGYYSITIMGWRGRVTRVMGDFFEAVTEGMDSQSPFPNLEQNKFNLVEVENHIGGGGANGTVGTVGLGSVGEFNPLASEDTEEPEEGECDNCMLLCLLEDLSLCEDGESRCGECYDTYIDEIENTERNYFSIPERSYDEKKHISKSKLDTKIMQSKRGFGIELECYANDEYCMNKISRQIDQKIGIAEDGSLGDGGFELQFPLINGKRGEEMVFNTCKMLNDTAFTNGTCGYHIHLQSYNNEHNYAFIQRLMFIALIFDNVVMSFLPESRRRNRYCMALREYITLDELLGTENKNDLDNLWYKTRSVYDIRHRKQGKYDDSRYYGFNFHCYLGRTRHLEIRHHTGTINPHKILHWANLHCLLLDAVKKSVQKEQKLRNWNMRDKFVEVYDENFSDKEVMKKKTEMFFDFIGLSKEGREYFINRQEKYNQ